MIRKFDFGWAFLFLVDKQISPMPRERGILTGELGRPPVRLTGMHAGRPSL